VPAERRGQAFGLANGGMQVFQGLWLIVVGALASLLGPGAVIAVALAARWAARTMPVAGRT